MSLFRVLVVPRLQNVHVFPAESRGAPRTGREFVYLRGRWGRLTTNAEDITDVRPELGLELARVCAHDDVFPVVRESVEIHD